MDERTTMDPRMTDEAQAQRRLRREQMDERELALAQAWEAAFGAADELLTAVRKIWPSARDMTPASRHSDLSRLERQAAEVWSTLDDLADTVYGDDYDLARTAGDLMRA